MVATAVVGSSVPALPGTDLDHLAWSVVAALAVVLSVHGAVMVWRTRRRERRRTAVLRRVFGPEYTRAVAASGGRTRAERELTARLYRRRDVRLRELTVDERERFEGVWQSALASFLEHPEGALRDADVLLVEVMRERGYPIDRFEDRAGLLSLDHPELAEYLRAAHRLAVLADEGEATDTEQMRQALVAYRHLLDALLGAGDVTRARGV